MRILRTTLLGLLSAGLFALASPASAVIITNPGFDDQTLADGSESFSPTGWFRDGSATAFNPTAAQAAPVSGANLARANPGGLLSQVLVGTALTVGTTYDLTVAVGSRIDVVNGAVYNIQLVANGDVLVETGNITLGQNVPLADVALPTYTGIIGHAQLGQDLQIVLLNPNPGGTGQALFDNVRLDAVPIPEPSSLILVGLGMLGLVGYGRRRR